MFPSGTFASRGLANSSKLYPLLLLGLLSSVLASFPGSLSHVALISCMSQDIPFLFLSQFELGFCHLWKIKGAD